jgi:hypothetical protein
MRYRHRRLRCEPWKGAPRGRLGAQEHGRKVAALLTVSAGWREPGYIV